MFRSVRGLGVAFSVLVALTALSDLIMAGWVWRVHGMLQGFLDGRVEEAELDRTLAATDLIDLAGTATYIAAGVVFVVWTWNARANAELVAPGAHHQHTKHMAIWGWLPILNFWIPRRVVADVWQASVPRRELGRGRAEVNWWWGLFLAYLVIDRVADRMLSRSETVDDLADGGAALAAVAALSVASAAAAALVVRRIGTWQSGPGFATPQDIASPTSAGLTPVDLPPPPARPTAPPVDDPRWQRPD